MIEKLKALISGSRDSHGSPGNQRPVLIYLHVPKAAGTTLSTIIDQNYPAESIFHITATPGRSVEDFKQLPSEQRGRFVVVQGHFPFGIHQHIPSEATYITLLRDPVERLISHYHFVLRTPEHYLYENVTRKQMTLADYVMSDISPELDNGQARMLSGVGRTLPIGECNKSLLDRAKQNVDERFSVIGVAERFDETLALLRREFGWKKLDYQRQNVTRDRPGAASLDSKTIEAIRARNWLDVELHRFAAAALDRAGIGAPP